LVIHISSALKTVLTTHSKIPRVQDPFDQVIGISDRFLWWLSPCPPRRWREAKARPGVNHRRSETDWAWEERTVWITLIG
jgi:hypothetical protein